MYKWDQLGGPSAQGTNDICHRSYCPGVVGLCTSGLNQQGGQLALCTLCTNAFLHRS